METPLAVALSIVGTAIVLFGVLFLLAGFNTRRLSLGLRVMTSGAELTDQVDRVLNPPPPEPPKPVKPDARPVRLLALLQREGRLLDFLLEDVQGASDDQLGAGVREIHRKCQAAVKEHLALEPVLTQAEGSTIEVPTGFDPSAIRLTGNVTGQPPFRGTLQHHGWRVKEIKLAPPPEGQDEMVLMPAEVELP
jgi:hypothetical protein